MWANTSKIKYMNLPGLTSDEFTAKSRLLPVVKSNCLKFESRTESISNQNAAAGMQTKHSC